MTELQATDYSDALADLICEHIVSGMSVRRICEITSMPSEDTVYKWLAKHSYFSEKYEEAVKRRHQT